MAALPESVLAAMPDRAPGHHLHARPRCGRGSGAARWARSRSRAVAIGVSSSVAPPPTWACLPITRRIYEHSAPKEGVLDSRFCSDVTVRVS
jgi:hypothetical protein